MKNNYDSNSFQKKSYWKKQNLKMKLSFILILLSICQFSANTVFSQDQINLSYTNTKLKTILTDINSQSGFKFFYNINEIDDSKKISIKTNKEHLNNVLEKLSTIASFKYTINKKQIVLTKKEIVLKPKIKAEQEREIKGIVINSQKEPLPGASISIKGTSYGTTTDFDGNFTLKIKDGNSVLIVSYIGFTTKEVVVNDRTQFTIELLPNAESLDEIVVTALGVSRDKQALGYSVESVDGGEVSEVKDANFINSLAGKSAGVNIKASGSMGGSTNVVIRGVSSLTGDNQALFVVDGTPINNNNNNSSDQATGKGGYDFGNAASDINPDDIASISILKGAAATALYGSRGSNGVILITTKRGSKNTGISTSVNTSIIFGTADKVTLPEYQNKYGSGFSQDFVKVDFDSTRPDQFFSDGNKDTFDVLVAPTGNGSQGVAFDPNLLVHQWDSFYPELSTYGKPTPWTAGKNTPLAFLETAITTINGISLQGGDEKSTFRLGYTLFDQKGILPNSNLKKHTVSFTASRNFNEKFKGSASVNYVKQNTIGRNGSGYDPRSSFMNFRQWWQVSTDILQLKDLYFSTKNNITNNPKSSSDLSPFWFNNPYWERYENFTTDQRNRYFGNVSLDYQIAEGISISGNVSFDTFTENIEERFAVGSSRVPYYSRYNGEVSEYNYNLLFNYTKSLNDNFNLDGTAGYTLRTNYWDQIKLKTNGGLGVANNLYSLSNSVSALQAPELEYLANKKVESFFARASLGYKGLLYTDFTYRVDRSSTLPVKNNTYGYPSISTSLIFSRLLKDVPWLNFGKFRANYAEVGNDIDPYKTNPNYILNSPINGIGQAEANGVLNNSDLTAERTSSYEFGLELKLFKRRVEIDASYYNKTTKDLLTPVSVSTALGISSKFSNAGSIRNRGLELMLNLKPIETDNFNWGISANWSKNKNTVLELANGLENLLLGATGGRGGPTINATPGHPYGTIRGSNFVFHENGEPIVGDNGAYLKSENSNEVIGNIQADWNAGIKNTFKYKNLKLSFSVDFQKGGDIFSHDLWYGYATGIYKNTVGLNDIGNPLRSPVSEGGGILLAGVNQNGTPNTVRGNMAGLSNVLGYQTAPNALHVYDASFVKLRELALSYSLPEKLLNKLPFSEIKGTITGRNLWIIHKNLPYSDPEAGLSSGNVQGFQSGVMPTTRELGFSLNLKF